MVVIVDSGDHVGGVGHGVGGGGRVVVAVVVVLVVMVVVGVWSWWKKWWLWWWCLRLVWWYLPPPNASNPPPQIRSHRFLKTYIILFWPYLGQVLLKFNDFGHFSRAKTMSFSKMPEFFKIWIEFDRVILKKLWEVFYVHDLISLETCKQARELKFGTATY